MLRKFLKLKLPLAFKSLVYLHIIIISFFYPDSHLFAQQIIPSLYKVLTLTGEKQGAKALPEDHGLTGLWQRLLKLKTTASVLHTQAHPDDEQADLITYLSREKGVRTALLSLNRGESGGQRFRRRVF